MHLCMGLPTGTWGPFHSLSLPAIQIRWKLRLAITPLLAIKSQQIFAHATTAQLPCHVQNFVVITVLELRWEWNEISIEFELRWKKLVKRAPVPQRLYELIIQIFEDVQVALTWKTIIRQSHSFVFGTRAELPRNVPNWDMIGSWESKLEQEIFTQGFNDEIINT